MGHTRSFEDALDFFPEARSRTSGWLGRLSARAKLIWDSFVESQLAAAHYRQLRARGLNHDVAIAEVSVAHFG